MKLTEIDQIAKNHPAVARLGRVGSKRVPVIVQLEAADCGPTCLQMILAYHGRDVRLEDLRIATGCGRDGVNALAIAQAARDLGMTARGVKIEPADLVKLESPAILHWGLNHFVVFERIHDGKAHIVDPAFGRVALSMDEVSRSFTGVTLLLEPQDGFRKEKLERPLRQYLARALRGSGDWARIVAVSLALQVCGLFLPLINGRVVDRVIPHADRHLLTVLVCGLVTVVIFEFLAELARANLLLNLRTRLDTQMTLGFLDHMLALPYAFFQRRSAGDLMMRLNSNKEIREILSAGVLGGAIDGTLVILYLALLVALSGKLAVVALALVLLQAGFYVVFRKKQAAILASSQQKQADSESYLIELLNGIETLKTTGGEARAAQRWSNLFIDVENLALQNGRIDAWSSSVMHVVTTVSPFVLLIVGTLEVMNGALTLGSMFSALAFANGFIGPVSRLVGTFSQFQLLNVYAHRIEDVLSTPREQERTDLRITPRLSGALDVDHVSFQYGPKTPLVVRDVSVQIRPGQTVAVVGRSGSGKSTLAALLAGLYMPTEGRITYDGINLADLHLPSLRRQIGVVVQRPYIFAGSIRSNITRGDLSIPQPEVEEAAHAAALHEEIEEMPMKYDTPLTPGGDTLSGGQRQRIAIAAALLKRPPILLLDEATSALDNFAERRVHENLDRLGCTRIVIAHRLSTIRRADVILVMERGVLVEQGSHRDLLARGGLYASLVAAPQDEEAAHGTAAMRRLA
jgi:ABC-type bacteriocin/lantibiotic exporter with double-glycine peptidase domain